MVISVYIIFVFLFKSEFVRNATEFSNGIKATLKMINMYEADKSDEQAVSPRNLDME